MKISSIKILLIFSAFILFLNLTTCSQKHRQRPDLQDLMGQMRVIRPLIEKPFIPQVVDNLADVTRKRQYIDDNMTNAQLVGPSQPQGEEKPTIYSIVIPSKSTSVSHPIPQPSGITVPATSLEAFKIDNGMIRAESGHATLPTGEYSVPVRIQSTPSNDPTLAKYSTPNFIQTKKENQIVTMPNTDPLPPVTVMKQSIANDIQSITSRMELVNNVQDKIKVLTDGKKRIAEEQQQLSDEVMKETKDLLDAKEASIKLNQILALYDLKLKKELVSKMKLSDEITLKQQLVGKLMKEIQGFKTGSTEFGDLQNVNPDDIQNVIYQVKAKLGNY